MKPFTSLDFTFMFIKYRFLQNVKAAPRAAFTFWWLRQESNLDLELRKLSYYPLYYEAGELLRAVVKPQ